MRILITGGAGYIGSVATGLLLKAGHEITVIDLLWFDTNAPLLYRANKNYSFIKGDAGNPKLLDKVFNDSVDYVIHMAAVVGDPASRKFPRLTYKNNYETSVKLIDMAKKSGVKGFIFLSTCSNYGVSDGIADEKSPLKPLSLYAETKVNVEKYLMDNASGLDWVICRLATVYGISPRMRFDLTVNDFTMKAFLKKYLEIFLPYTNRPYIHVFDVGRVLSEIVGKFNKLKNNVINIGFNDENYPKIKIAEIVKEFIPDLQLGIVQKGQDARDYRVDFSKLKGYVDIKNNRSVGDGVKEIINSMKNRIFNNPENEIYYNTHPKLGDEIEVGA